MAPKRSGAEGKVDEAAGDGAEVQEWKSSKCTDSHLLNLVESHLLQPQNIIHWRRSDGESFPPEGENESVVFLPYVLRGLGFPISDFFRGLLFNRGWIRLTFSLGRSRKLRRSTRLLELLWWRTRPFGGSSLFSGGFILPSSMWARRIVAKMASHAIFQYNVLVIDINNTTLGLI